MARSIAMHPAEQAEGCDHRHVTSIAKTRLTLLLAVTEKVKKASRVMTAILTFPLLLALSNCQLISYQKGQR